MTDYLDYRRNDLRRIALALETLAGCTGWVDEDGTRQHDGVACPVHESQDATPTNRDEYRGPSFADGS